MTPQERRAIILTLLENWPEFFEPGGSGKPSSGDGTPILSVSTMAQHPSVRELGRLLAWLRDKGPAHYGAVRMFFDSPFRTWDKPVRRRTLGGGRQVWETRRVRERVLPRELERFPKCSCRCGLPRPVCVGVDVLGSAWSPVVVLELPAPLLAKLTTFMDPVTGEEGWTERRVA